MLTILNLIPYGLPKVLAFSPMKLGQRKWETLHVHIKTYSLGIVKSFWFFLVCSCDGPIKLANCWGIKKIKKKEKRKP
jgi:hypothetical protein